MGHILPASVAIISRGLPIFCDTVGNLESLSRDPLVVSCATHDKISKRRSDSLAVAAVTYTSKISLHPSLDVYL